MWGRLPSDNGVFERQQANSLQCLMMRQRREARPSAAVLAEERLGAASTPDDATALLYHVIICL